MFVYMHVCLVCGLQPVVVVVGCVDKIYTTNMALITSCRMWAGSAAKSRLQACTDDQLKHQVLRACSMVKHLLHAWRHKVNHVNEVCSRILDQTSKVKKLAKK